MLRCELFIPHFHFDDSDDSVDPDCLHFSLFPHIGFLCKYVPYDRSGRNKHEVQVDVIVPPPLSP